VAINLILRQAKGQPLTAEEHDRNLRELVQKLAPVENPVFQGITKVPTPGVTPEPDEAVNVRYLRQALTGTQAEGSITYALVGASNVFTQPQRAAAATQNSELATLGQVNERGFEPGDIKASLTFRDDANWRIADGAFLPTPAALPTDANYAERVRFERLFAAIGYAWGGSAATRQFRIPDYRGRTLLGIGAAPGLTNRTINTAGGAEAVALSLEQIPDHAHTYSFTQAAAASLDGGPNGVFTVLSIANAFTGGVAQRAAGQQNVSLMQPWHTCYYLIKL
jgi:microcystin-dependent protein